MRHVLAALDSSAAARPVLDAATRLAELTAAEVEAVHVSDGSTETAAWLAARCDIPLRLLDSPVGSSLVRAVEQDESVIAAVFGARSTQGGRRPAGRTAMHVLQHATKPIIVVPPGVAAAERPYRRLLLPLEGDLESSRPILERLFPLFVHDVELVVLHVFTSETAPRILDRPARDLSMWGDEFIARFCPGATRIELCTGPVSARVDDVVAEEATDMVVLTWSRDISGGHGAVIREVLGRSTVPVLLLPVVATSAREGPSALP
jgi:nucleotide-binding universal stress UspA family protein